MSAYEHPFKAEVAATTPKLKAEVDVVSSGGENPHQWANFVVKADVRTIFRGRIHARRDPWSNRARDRRYVVLLTAPVVGDNERYISLDDFFFLLTDMGIFDIEPFCKAAEMLGWDLEEHTKYGVRGR